LERTSLGFGRLACYRTRQGNATKILTIQRIEVLNTNQVICTLDKKQKFEAEFDVRIGRGFFTRDENKRADMPLGVIPIDSIFSSVITLQLPLLWHRKIGLA
jgi:DNA-directed RNA polymerase alpha subunit